MKGIYELDGRLGIPDSSSSHVKFQALWKKIHFMLFRVQCDCPWFIQDASFKSVSILKSCFPHCRLQQLFPSQLHTCPVLTFRFVRAKQYLVEGKLPKYFKKICCHTVYKGSGRGSDSKRKKSAFFSKHFQSSTVEMQMRRLLQNCRATVTV